ncbi:hypothetical protein Tco_0459043, partial [Tanacetum coccineum]
VTILRVLNLGRVASEAAPYKLRVAHVGNYQPRLPFEFIIASYSTDVMMKFQSILQSEKLTGPNFTNWHQNLRIVFMSENKLVHLEHTLIPIPLPTASQAAQDAYKALFDAQNEVACLMLHSMSLDLQRSLENYKAYDMIQEIKTMFEERAKQELFKTVKALHACKQDDGQSVSSSLLKIKSYLDTLVRLGFPMVNELGKRIEKLQRDRILQPTGDESFEKCKSCISGKMERKPFLHQVERAKELPGLIYTGVCGPFRNMSREGAS